MTGRFPRPFWVLVAATGLESFGAGLWLPYWALYLTSERGATGAQAGALIALGGGMGLLGAPLGGAMTDRLGRRRTILIGLAIAGGGHIAYGLLGSLVALAVLTPFSAIGSDIWSPAIAAAIADVVAPEQRTEAYGLQRQVGSIAFALGPPVGALLTLGLPLRALWLGGGAGGLAALAVVWRGLPETMPERAEHEPPPRLRTALRDRRLLFLALGTGIATIVYVQFNAVLGVFLHRDRGYALAAWGFLFGINPILVGLLQYPVARWAGRRSARAMLALGAVLQGVALFVLWPSSGVPLLVAAIVVLTVGEMILSPVASTVAAHLAPPHLRGSYEGVAAVAFAASFAPGTFVGLWLVGAGHGELMLALALPLSLVAALCFAPLPRR